MIQYQTVGPVESEIKICTSLKCNPDQKSRMLKTPKLVRKGTLDCPDCRSILLKEVKRFIVKRRQKNY